CAEARGTGQNNQRWATRAEQVAHRRRAVDDYSGRDSPDSSSSSLPGLRYGSSPPAKAAPSAIAATSASLALAARNSSSRRLAFTGISSGTNSNVGVSRAVM